MDAVIAVLGVVLGWLLNEVSSWIQSIRKSSEEERARIDELAVDTYMLDLDAAAWAQAAFRSNLADLDDDQRIVLLTGRAYQLRAAALRMMSTMTSEASNPIARFRRIGDTPTPEIKRLRFIEEHCDHLCSTLIATRDIMRQKSWGPHDPVYVGVDALRETADTLERYQQKMARYLAANDHDLDEAIAAAT